jgi:hypothetical protein
MYYYRPDDIWGHGETLSNDFWVRASTARDRSNPLGWALMQAKKRMTIGNDFDRKTVQTFTYFGLPWMRLASHSANRASRPAYQLVDSTSSLWSSPTASLSPEASYAIVAHVDASTYATTVVEGYDRIEVDGLGQRAQTGQVVLPQATLDVILPLSATLSSLVFTPTQAVALPGLDLPIILADTTLPEGPTGGYAPAPDGLYAATVVSESHKMEGYQLVRLQVVPVTYDATNDQATLYREVDVRIEYDSPRTIALTYFEPDEIQYLPGEPISTTAHLVNAGDVAETVTATLLLQDAEDQIVGFQASAPFEVPAGGRYDLELGWTGSLDDDLYLARLLIWQGGQVLAGAGSVVAVAAGQVSDLTGPDHLLPGEAGTFEVQFDNLGVNNRVAIASLAIYDADDALVDLLPAPAAIVAGGGSTTLSFTWTPDQVGDYTASFVLSAGGQEYGPFSQRVEVGYRVYLPLAIRGSD